MVSGGQGWPEDGVRWSRGLPCCCFSLSVPLDCCPQLHPARERSSSLLQKMLPLAFTHSIATALPYSHGHCRERVRVNSSGHQALWGEKGSFGGQGHQTQPYTTHSTLFSMLLKMRSVTSLVILSIYSRIFCTRSPPGTR